MEEDDVVAEELGHVDVVDGLEHDNVLLLVRVLHLAVVLWDGVWWCGVVLEGVEWCWVV